MGRGFRGDQGGITLANIHHAVAVTSYDGDDDEKARRAFADQNGRQINEWVGAVTEWLEVLAEIDVQPHRRTGSADPRFVHPMPIHFDEQGSPYWFTTMKQSLTSYGDRDASSRADWRRAVGYANAEHVAPPEYLLLRDARAAMRRARRRAALIDAGTAAEVALERAIRQRLDSLGILDEQIEQVLKNASGLIDLFDLFSAVGVAPTLSRRRVMNQLAGKRNKAAHLGIVPALNETILGLKVASELLAEIAPLAEGS